MTDCSMENKVVAIRLNGIDETVKIHKYHVGLYWGDWNISAGEVIAEDLGTQGSRDRIQRFDLDRGLLIDRYFAWK